MKQNDRDNAIIFFKVDSGLCLAFLLGAMLLFPLLALQALAADKQRGDKAQESKAAKYCPRERLTLGLDAYGNGKQPTRNDRADAATEGRQGLGKAVECAQAIV